MQSILCINQRLTKESATSRLGFIKCPYGVGIMYIHLDVMKRYKKHFI